MRTSPRDCALAIAIPLTEEEVEFDLQPDNDREYVKEWACAKNLSMSRPAAVWSIYRHLEAERIGEICDDLREMEVEVITGCTGTQFVELCGRKQVVILAAHWSSGLLRPRDVRNARALVRCLGTDEERALQQVRDGLRALDGLTVADDTDDETIKALLDRLNEVLRTHGQTSAARSLGVVCQAFLLSRQEAVIPLLHAAGAVAFRMGGVDFSDAIWSASALCDSLPSGFAAQLDLTVCCSIPLAERLKRRHPSCRSIANRHATRPLIRLEIAREVIRRLSRWPDDYIDTMSGLRD